MTTTNPNRCRHLSNGVTIIFLRHKGRTLRCLVLTRDYPKVRGIHWSAFYQAHLGGYYAGTHGGLLMHRLLMPECAVVDHRQHRTLDNRIYNPKTGEGSLRAGTPTTNAQNRRKRSDKCSSVFKGVAWHKRMKLWSARIQVDGRRRIWLGAYDSELDGARAYDAAAREVFGDFALLNLSTPSCIRRKRT